MMRAQFSPWRREARRSIGAAVVLGAFLAAACGVPDDGPPLLGFDPERAGVQRDAERRFMAGVSTEAMSDIHREVTGRPHVAGSAASMDVAAAVERALKTAGLTTEVHEYQVLLSTPESVWDAIRAFFNRQHEAAEV